MRLPRTLRGALLIVLGLPFSAFAAPVSVASFSPPGLHTNADPCVDPCDDGNACTVNDHCSNDHCRGVTLPNGTACDGGLAATCNGGMCGAGASDAGAEDAAAPSGGLIVEPTSGCSTVPIVADRGWLAWLAFVGVLAAGRRNRASR